MDISACKLFLAIERLVALRQIVYLVMYNDLTKVRDIELRLLIKQCALLLNTTAVAIAMMWEALATLPRLSSNGRRSKFACLDTDAASYTELLWYPCHLCCRRCFHTQLACRGMTVMTYPLTCFSCMVLKNNNLGQSALKCSGLFSWQALRNLNVSLLAVTYAHQFWPLGSSSCTLAGISWACTCRWSKKVILCGDCNRRSSFYAHLLLFKRRHNSSAAWTGLELKSPQPNIAWFRTG